MSESLAAAPAVEVELDQLWQGLNEPQKRVSSKYFYDQRGSRLFEEITRLEEYYPTRTELALLERWAGPIVSRLRPRTLLELGAGSARKTRVLLDAMTAEGIPAGPEAQPGRRPGERSDLQPPPRYVPVDVSGEFLQDTAEGLRSEYPGLDVVPEVADFADELNLAHEIPRPAIVALLGSTIGNFPGAAALGIVRSMASLMGPSDHLLLGADLRPGAQKSVAELERAYNDGAGTTAEFNLNLLRVLNEGFGTDFNPGLFRHRAVWVEEKGRIEMHLVAEAAHPVQLPGRGTVEFRSGESLRTEISCKYDRGTIQALFERAGLRLTDWLDAEGRYALVLGRLAV